MLKSAHAGDTILLEAGTYSSLSLTGLKFDGLVTIASKDPNDPAVLSGLSVNNSEGLKFSNLEVDLSSMKAGWGVNLYGSKNIELSGLDVHGSLNNNPGDDQAGLLIRNSSDVRVLGSEFHEVGNGVNLVASNGVRLEGNAFHDVRSDGIQSSGASNIKIVGNTFTDFKPGVGDHPDAIQFFTAGNTTSAHDIEISDNLITRGEGATFQGIFVTDQVGNLPYQNVVITNNVVAGGLYNGIYVQSSDHLTLTGNTVAAYGDMQSWISVFDSSSAVVSGNEALKFSFRNTPDLVNTGNTAIPVVLDTLQFAVTGKLDRLEGGEFDDALSGTAHNNGLYGHEGRDVLSGGEGRDWLEGGAGADTLIGGAGADRFSFGAGDLAADSAPVMDWTPGFWTGEFGFYGQGFTPSTSVVLDRIEDFSSADGDRIVVSAIDANSLTSGDDRFVFIGARAFSHTAGELRYEVVDGGAKISGDLNGDGAGDFQIQVAGVNVLASADFVL